MRDPRNFAKLLFMFAGNRAMENDALRLAHRSGNPWSG